MIKDITIKKLNNLSEDDFTQVLAEIYEHSSWIPRKAWSNKPYDNMEHLHQTMLKIVEDATLEQKLALLRAHPQLAGKEAKDGTLTGSSTEEQSTANLNALSKGEMDDITELNQRYVNNHEFPFIIAVKNHDKAGIFSEFKRRINNPTDEELNVAIQQVGLIANFRLTALFH
ncbi:MAG: 2-oxo-4-hydroxy-4-carboxy-5-ureidoimidazoline decarboxylase [Glaciecola sp.]|jgi:2-oxo-4-hydroxy-4-carboxy-5-ureidoimidazoline decarboxylase